MVVMATEFTTVDTDDGVRVLLADHDLLALISDT
jgi:hypothetical protein